MEEEIEEEAHRDSYLLLSLFLLFPCPPSAAAPSSFIALLLLNSGEPRRLFSPLASARIYVYTENAPTHASPALAVYFYCDLSLPLSPLAPRTVFPLFPSLPRRRFFLFSASSFSPRSSFSPPRARVARGQYFPRGMATGTRASAFARYSFFPVPPSFLPSFFASLFPRGI